MVIGNYGQNLMEAMNILVCGLNDYSILNNNHHHNAAIFHRIGGECYLLQDYRDSLHSSRPSVSRSATIETKLKPIY